jgi:hypothetical protein
VRFGFDHGKPVQGSIRRDGYRGLDVHHIENALEGLLAIFHKIDEYSLRDTSRCKIYIVTQPVQGISVQKIELIPTAHPYSSRFNVQMAYLAGLNI